MPADSIDALVSELNQLPKSAVMQDLRRWRSPLLDPSLIKLDEQIVKIQVQGNSKNCSLKSGRGFGQTRSGTSAGAQQRITRFPRVLAKSEL